MRGAGVDLQWHSGSPNEPADADASPEPGGHITYRFWIGVLDDRMPLIPMKRSGKEK